MADGGGRQGRARRGDRVSTLLFAAMAVVLVAIGVIYVRDWTDEEPTPVPPTSSPGGAQSIHVLNALAAQDLEASFGRQTIPIGILSEPGQQIVVEGVPLYAFIYPDVASREEEGAAVDADEVLAAAPGTGTPGAGGAVEAHVAQHSNVLVVLAGGDEELVAKVERAVESIP